MYLIGLTGGIASGKSVVARRLAEHGAVHVDADVLAREVVEPGTPGLAAIAERFGPSVIAADGTLDRAALGAIIFRDPEERAALNAITHPAVWARAKELFDAAAAADPHAVVVYDVPLLVEASSDRPMRFDLIVVVHADLETRLQRMVELRGMTREEAVHRLNSQASDTERLAIADVVIDANGTLDETLAQADGLWAMAAASARSTVAEVDAELEAEAGT
jgi:dephospho-CoA kinase